jgi:uncharacterized membrane protein YozB (DUF420 family)
MTTKPSTARSDWLVPGGLMLLTAVPAIAGALRVAELTGGAQITPDNARFFASPVPVLLHIVGATLYCLLGALQFAPGFRRRRPGWHRAAGRILAPAGLVAALAGLWMTVFYPRPDGVGELLSGLRLLFGSAMVLSIVAGVLAILRHDIVRHSAWMTRGYAIGLGAGTQVLTNLTWLLIAGEPDEFGFAMAMAAGWVINLAVAEWVIRRVRPRRAAASAGAAGQPMNETVTSLST